MPSRSHAAGSLALILTTCLILVLPAAGAPNEGSPESWPTFRGPDARGVAEGQDPPVAWNAETGESVRWRTAIPGLGHSSPIVWGDRVFVTTAMVDEAEELQLGDSGGIGLAKDERPYTWTVLALDAHDGSLLWRRDVVSRVPRAKRHLKSSQANSTPATDGQTLVAILGSEGLFAFDLDGRKLWQKDLGLLDPGFFSRPDSQWGYGSSPILAEGKVIVQVDRHEKSYLAAFDAHTGEELWKVARDERPVWATPTYHDGHGRKELIVMGGYHIRGYRLEDGQEIWRFGDDGQVKTPTPFVAGDRIILAGGYRARPIFAIDAGGKGDLGSTEKPEPPGSVVEEETETPPPAPPEGLLWRTEAGGPYTTTPIVYGSHVYSVTDKGILAVFDLETGERLERVRTDEHFSASPVAANGHLYFAGEGGVVLVVKAGTELEIVAKNDLGETLMATPAIAHDTLYVRSSEAVWALGSAGAEAGTKATPPATP